ncbi:MAG: leucine-rich repeat domain-containing protein [Treponema sp.]|jgi:hypothetical protein|nr:leucine-rich repeat domain-containing protein [Treponema sp.]
MKKIKLRAVLFFAFIFGLVAQISAQQMQDGFGFEIVDRRSITILWYEGDAETINIPGRIQGLPVTGIGDGVFADCGSLTSITIPASVRTIGDYTFRDCASLTDITLPSSVTSIGDRAFENCVSLISITLPPSVRSIGASVFGGCKSLTSISVDRQNSVYTSLDGVLFDKRIRTILVYPAGRRGGAYSIPASVTSIGNAAFVGCFNLTEITIPSSVTTIGDWAFFACDNLTSITLPSSVTTIGNYAFVGCNSFISITLPSSVISIGEEAFSFCGSLTDITIPSSVISIRINAFRGCTSLTNIAVDRQNPSYASVDGVLFDKNMRTIIVYPDGKNAEIYSIPSSVMFIGPYAFMDCIGLKSVTIPSSVTSIGDGAFSWCNSLTNVIIPPSVTSIGEHAFYACNSLMSITLSRRTRVGGDAFPRSAQIIYKD